MKNLRIQFKGVSKPKEKIYTVEVRVSDEKNTVRCWREELYPPINALAKQMNRKKLDIVKSSVDKFKKEFELGEWDDERFRNLVV